MTIGEHLEELRRRLILALGGFLIAGAVCLFFGKETLAIFCAPFLDICQAYDINPQLFYTDVSDAFMAYMKISLICAAAIASPWMVYQFWLFIAAGLYAHEQKVITKYVPLSITLLISGMVFVYYLVLPWTLQFFLAFSISIPLPGAHGPTTQVSTTAPAVVIPIIEGDPLEKQEGQIWLNQLDGRLKLYYKEKVRVVSFGPANLTAPMITLPNYIDLVFGMLLVFGLSFQMPLVVIALVTIGIVERDALKAARRYVYFALSIVAAAITPGDFITATIALLIPLCGLYELGILLSRERKPDPEDTVE